MFGPLGVSFAPTNDQAANGPQTGVNEGVQQALKVLSLRLPQNVSSPIAPMSLMMQGPRSADWVQSILRALALGQTMPTPDPNVRTIDYGTPALPNPLTPQFTPQSRRPGGLNFAAPQGIGPQPFVPEERTLGRYGLME